MGLLDRFLKPTPDRFARQFMKGLRAAGLADELRYEPEEFRVVRFRDGKRVGFSNLANYYRNYVEKPHSERAACLRDAVRTTLTDARTIPEDFEAARPDVRAKLWGRSGIEQIRLRILVDEGDEKGVDLPGEPIGAHLLACPVFDWPEATHSVNSKTLETWGVSLYEALEAARENLAETLPGYAKMGDGLYILASGDTFDAARVLLVDRIREFEVKGDHVAMVPNRDHLLVTGSEDDTGLAMMVAMAEQHLTESYAISPRALVLESDGWNDWEPPEGHPVSPKLRDMELKWLGREYAEQTKLLNALHQARDIPIVAGSYTAVKKPDGSLVSYCVWGEGVDWLLPVTQKVVLMRKEVGNVALGTWERVHEAAGAWMEPTDHCPPRYRVREFPDQAALDAIGIGEM
jgi:hypothetical protein